MSGARAVAAACMALVMAGCGSNAPGPATPEAGTADATTGEATSTQPASSAGPPPPPPGPRIVAAGGGTVTRVPTFSMPAQEPGAHWERVELSARMPAGSWLLVHVPLPPGQGNVTDEIVRTFRVAGNASGDAGYVAFAPFLVQNDMDGLVPETYLQEQAAAWPVAGAWTYAPEAGEIVPFGGTHYAGILAFAAATSDWDLRLELVAPWEGEGTVGPEHVAWGGGFAIHHAPPMAQSGTGNSESSLDWRLPLAEGWVVLQARPGCYTPSPCADAVAEEHWSVTFPGGALSKEYHRTPTSGAAPAGYLAVPDAPAGELRVEGRVQGLAGPRAFDAFAAPVPQEAWPFQLAAGTAAWQ